MYQHKQHPSKQQSFPSAFSLFCDGELLAKLILVLENFYLKVIIPELLIRRFENDADSKICVGSGSNRKYCI